MESFKRRISWLSIVQKKKDTRSQERQAFGKAKEIARGYTLPRKTSCWCVRFDSCRNDTPWSWSIQTILKKHAWRNSISLKKQRIIANFWIYARNGKKGEKGCGENIWLAISPGHCWSVLDYEPPWMDYGTNFLNMKFLVYRPV